MIGRVFAPLLTIKNKQKYFKNCHAMEIQGREVLLWLNLRMSLKPMETL